MTRHHIVFLERDSIRATVRRPDFDHDWTEFPATLPDDTEARLAGASIAIVNKLPIGAALLERLPDLRLVAVAATGTDKLDLDWCRRLGVAVTHIRGYAATTVPEHALTLMLMLRRNVLAYRASLLEGRWQRAANFCYFDYPVRDLSGAVLAIVGSGSLGGGVARLAEAFGMRVVHAERKGAAACRPDRVPFDEALRSADVVTLHCPLVDATRDLIGEPELRAMKPEAILINTARGGLVNEAALARALREGWIGGAGFDVLTTEPPRAGNPLLELDLPNFILTPHVAWASEAAMQTLADQLIDNIEAFVRGEVRNRVV
ncbi:MAG: D-2-hydroxyacid dehydrogenase [Betaproteobacteria bacterium]|nr:D-2-hydroxyacid dehydrogenase [Betaproteobacteria bacterium]